jgi:hypothetical protein
MTCKKSHFHCAAHDEPITTQETKSEIEFFEKLLYTALMSIKEGLKQLNQHKETWRFLCKISELSEKRRAHERLFRYSVGFNCYPQLQISKEIFYVMNKLAFTLL